MDEDDAIGPLGTANFRVIIAGVEIGFASVSGISSEATPDEKGANVFRTVMFRRAVDGTKDLWNWRRAVVEGKDDRRDVVIEHLDDHERVANTWVLHEAWPVRWSGPAFDAMMGGVAMEELELSYRRLTWDHPPDSEHERSHHAGRS